MPHSSGFWIALPGYVLFFMMLFVPTAYQEVKACLLLLVVGMISVGVLQRDRLTLHPVVLLWVLFLATVGLAFMLLGLANGTPGALRVGTVYVLWPLVYSLMVAGTAHEKVLRELSRILVAATIAIGLYGMSYILHAAGWLPDFLYIPIDQGQEIGFYQGFVEFRLYAISSLLFLVPFLVAALLTWPADQTIPVSRLGLWVAFIAGSMLTLLTGRRALLLVIGLSPLVALIFRAFLPLSEKQRQRTLVIRFFTSGGLALIGLVSYLNFISGFDVLAVVDMFVTGFDFTGAGDIGASERSEQFVAMLQAWPDHLWFGFGHGASVPGSIRASDMPWAYELSYMALLFHTGILGFLAYTAGVVWIFWMGVRIIRFGNELSLYMVPILVGTACFLIANATNPYLEKYDYLWVIFLPVAYINLWLLTDQEEVASASE
jgi:hypothetical protein